MYEVAQLLIHKKANLDAGWDFVEFCIPKLVFLELFEVGSRFAPVATKAIVVRSLGYIQGFGKSSPLLVSLHALARPVSFFVVVSGARAELQCWSAYRAVVREPSRRRSSIYGLGFGCAALCSSGPAGEHATQILLWTSKYMLAWSTNMWFWVRAGDDASCVLLSLCCVARARSCMRLFLRADLCVVWRSQHVVALAPASAGCARGGCSGIWCGLAFFWARCRPMSCNLLHSHSMAALLCSVETFWLLVVRNVPRRPLFRERALGFGPRLLHLSVVEDIGHWALSQMVPGVLHCFLTFFQARKVARETRSRVG